MWVHKLLEMEHIPGGLEILRARIALDYAPYLWGDQAPRNPFFDFQNLFDSDDFFLVVNFLFDTDNFIDILFKFARVF